MEMIEYTLKTEQLRAHESTLARLKELANHYRNRIDILTIEIDNDSCKDVIPLLDKRSVYRTFLRRTENLIFFKNHYPNRSFGYRNVLQEYFRKSYKELTNERKVEGKIRFEKTHRYQLHFYSNSLSADYGTFKCEKCSNTFYHSPSTIFLGKHKIYNYCCGNCVNQILINQGNKPIYY